MRTEPTTGVTTRPGTATCVLHEETYDHPDGSCPRCHGHDDDEATMRTAYMRDHFTESDVA